MNSLSHCKKKAPFRALFLADEQFAQPNSYLQTTSYRRYSATKAIVGQEPAANLVGDP